MRKPTKDVEKLAEEAKVKRQTECSEKINKILEEERCQFTIFARVGDLIIPLDQILNLPVVLNVTSK